MNLSSLAYRVCYLAVAFVGSIASSTAFAHPGHAVEVVDSQSPAHYILQPEHGLPLLVLAAVISWFYYQSLQSRRVSA